jgi:hypothetical protein
MDQKAINNINDMVLALSKDDYDKINDINLEHY